MKRLLNPLIERLVNQAFAVDQYADMFEKLSLDVAGRGFPSRSGSSPAELVRSSLVHEKARGKMHLDPLPVPLWPTKFEVK